LVVVVLCGNVVGMCQQHFHAGTPAGNTPGRSSTCSASWENADVARGGLMKIKSGRERGSSLYGHSSRHEPPPALEMRLGTTATLHVAVGGRSVGKKEGQKMPLGVPGYTQLTPQNLSGRFTPTQSTPFGGTFWGTFAFPDHDLGGTLKKK
jgi:hypothetical protein